MKMKMRIKIKIVKVKIAIISIISGQDTFFDNKGKPYTHPGCLLGCLAQPLESWLRRINAYCLLC